MKRLLLALLVLPSAAPAEVRIAFGSCNQHGEPQGHWDVIGGMSPHLWAWLGDNIYADHKTSKERARRYGVLKRSAPYRRFLREVPVVGTWDDHDYAYNNARGGYSERSGSKKALMDFLGEPQGSERRSRAGVYAAYDVERVKLVLLDTRWFREGDSGSILGPAQWAWLERELADPAPSVTLLASSIQVLPRSPDESWSQHPAERRRLLELLDRLSGEGRRFVLLSGDRHYAEVSAVDLPGGRRLYEFTSSGLTHANPSFVGPAELRVGGAHAVPNFGIVRVLFADDGTPAVRLEAYSTTTGLLESWDVRF